MPPKRKAAAEPAVASRASKRTKPQANVDTAGATTDASPKAAAVKKATPEKKPAPAKAATAKKPAAPKKVAPAKKAVAPKKIAAPKKAAPAETDAPGRKIAPVKKVAAPKKAPVFRVKARKIGPAINEVPTTRLDVYVCGAGDGGELGLGTAKYDGGKKPFDVQRPRLNHLLDAKNVGVVRLAVGGMHTAAITYDNKILTWGVNDNGALGRILQEWSAPEVEAGKNENGDDSDSDEEASHNPFECAPFPVDSKYFPEGTVFTDVCCTDNATFVLTQDGVVYGWGQFLANEGSLGFSKTVKKQNTPVLIAGLTKIVQLAGGSNHMLALDVNGKIFAWGAGQQNQLGRRIVERTRINSLVPMSIGTGRIKFKYIACGDYTSFGIDTKGNVYSWGLNNYGQSGHDAILDGEGDETIIPQPTIVDNLKEFDIEELSSGASHTLALAADGKILAFGRCNSEQLGVSSGDLPKEKLILRGGHAEAYKGILILPELVGVHVAVGGESSSAVTKDGKLYTWGYNFMYQLGQGKVDIVNEATLVDNTAVRDKKLTWSGVGGQFGVYAGPSKIQK